MSALKTEKADLIIEAFLETLSAEQGVSKHTLLAYRNDLTGFLNFLNQSEQELLRAQTQHVIAYLAELQKQKKSMNTSARAFSSLNKFYTYLLLETLIPHNPIQHVLRPKTSRPLPKYLSEEEVTRLIDAAYDHTPTSNKAVGDKKRMICLLEILYSTGVRVSELVSIMQKNISLRGRLIVQGKGNRERMIPVGEKALLALSQWLEWLAEQKLYKGSPYLFPSRGASGHLTRQRFTQLLEDYGVRAGLASKKLTPHILRHAFATHLLARGAQLRSVQTMLGHNDISTTQIYTHVLQSHQQELVENAHPLAGKTLAGKTLAKKMAFKGDATKNTSEK